MRYTTLVPVVALFASASALLLSHAEPAAARPSHAQRSDTIVLPSGPPLHPEAGTLVEDLTIGGSATVEVYRFSNIRDLSPGRDGSIFVIDWALGMGGPVYVRNYDRTGKYLHSFGRKGQGPGEYPLAPFLVRELVDGRVIVSDLSSITEFSAAGEPRGKWKLGQVELNGLPIRADTAGVVYLPASKRANGRLLGTMVIRVRSDGTIIDTVITPENPPRDPSLPRLPFTPALASAWSPLGYYVTAFTGSYAVDLRIPTPGGGTRASQWRAGDPVRSIRRTIPPVPVQSAERADWRADVEYTMRMQPATPGWRWTGPDIPRVKPPIRALKIAEDGRIWVQLSEPGHLDASVELPTNATAPGNGPRRAWAGARWPEPVVYDVFEPGGRYVGRVPIPDGLGSVVFQGDTVWGVVRDSDDVPMVKRYHIRWGG